MQKTINNNRCPKKVLFYNIQDDKGHFCKNIWNKLIKKKQTIILKFILWKWYLLYIKKQYRVSNFEKSYF